MTVCGWKLGGDGAGSARRPRAGVPGQQGLRSHPRLAVLLPLGQGVPQGEPRTSAGHGVKGPPEDSGPPPLPSEKAGSRIRAQAPAGGCLHHCATTGGTGQPAPPSAPAEPRAGHSVAALTRLSVGHGEAGPFSQRAARLQGQARSGPAYLTDCRRDCRPSEEPTVG